MKKILLLAVCAVGVMIGCKNKGKTGAATAQDSVAAVIDSIIEENDTTPMPMFLMGQDKQYGLMLYWTDLEEPQKTDDNDDYFETSHQLWTLQDMFRRNKTAYTNMLMDGKFFKIKFIDEVLEDPDGNRPGTGERHRPEIPSLCARFDFANPKEKVKEEWGYDFGTVIVTDSYLASRKLLPVEFDEDSWSNPKPLPAAIVSQLEKKYGMKVDRMRQVATIDGRYLWCVLQFKGQWKNAPKDNFYGDSPVGLGLDVLIDGDKYYVNEELGMYDKQYGTTWNADDEGEYGGHAPVAVFEGPKGLEICFERGAPESTAVGMFFLRGGQLVKVLYETYHNMVDEEIPVWKKDIAEMRRLFLADDPHAHKDIRLSKWTHTYFNLDNEWILMRDSLEQHGALFVRKDGKISLVGVETERLKFSSAYKDGACYLKLSGPAGGPSYYTRVWVFEDERKKEEFTALEIYGEVSEGTINGHEASQEAVKERFDRLPQGEPLRGYFENVPF